MINLFSLILWTRLTTISDFLGKYFLSVLEIIYNYGKLSHACGKAVYYYCIFTISVVTTVINVYSIRGQNQASELL